MALIKCSLPINWRINYWEGRPSRQQAALSLTEDGEMCRLAPPNAESAWSTGCCPECKIILKGKFPHERMTLVSINPVPLSIPLSPTKCVCQRAFASAEPVYHSNTLFKICILTARKTKVKNRLKAIREKWTAAPRTASEDSNKKQKKYVHNVDVHSVCWELAGC